ncbi:MULTISPECIES: hypothetical protein [Mesorhizobium]|uniref:Uncharacterized protein n=1 Tax=Mesorhizobium shonense TaxID=1209948 RepID=A0ABV2I078_9HYPH|nr:hypothetical protein [Mesorhizobium sp.]RWB20882.1 MAG: hypothetical protein EOQ40_13310 [Mesorhizobium sp.]RWD99065.1 MAG: hypothetical protein EOS40_21310 [Mesorhizobium sp.]
MLDRLGFRTAGWSFSLVTRHTAVAWRTSNLPPFSALEHPRAPLNFGESHEKASLSTAATMLVGGPSALAQSAAVAPFANSAKLDTATSVKTVSSASAFDIESSQPEQSHQ